MRIPGIKPVSAVFVHLLLMILVAGHATAQNVLVPEGSVWRYLDDGSNQGVPWRDPGFNDGTWSSGPAQLGYGDGDEATVVSFGPNSGNKYITTYFRLSFEVEDPSLFSYLQLRLLCDDGGVLYLNGSEIQRSNMPDGTITHLTLASSTIGGSAEDAFVEHIVDASALVPGPNVLAVEIHQRSVTSSDISFDLEVIGLGAVPHPMRKAPYVIYMGDNTGMQVQWQLTVTDTCTIEWGLDETYSLGSVETLEYGDDHQHSFTIGGLAPSAICFYRVVAREDTISASFRSAPPDDTTDVAFLVYGDTRTYPGSHDLVAQEIVSTFTTNPALHSLLVNVGDLVSSGDNESSWDTEFFDPSYTGIRTMLASLPHQACRGNHEDSGVVFSKYFPYPFETPLYWSFDYGPAHFVVIDQYRSYAPGSVQHDWIEADLTATTKPWKFFVFHEPGWSAGGHGNNTSVQDYLQPLCIEHEVSIAFTGHNHYYARAVVNDVQHITTGGGGAPLYVPNPDYPNIVTVTQDHHFCTVRIEGSNLSFAAISAAGDTIDHFTMNRPVSSVEEAIDGPAARGVILDNAFPNPFNPISTIAFSLPGVSLVELDVIDLKGQVVRTLMKKELPAGRQSVSWDGVDKTGRMVGSGIYFFRLRSEGGVFVKKITLIK
ncbi:MAG: metallophosphoesterase [Candidatus Krumholzibacteriota bacterium]